jgi:Flp pilus assembly protein TadD
VKKARVHAAVRPDPRPARLAFAGAAAALGLLVLALASCAVTTPPGPETAALPAPASVSGSYLAGRFALRRDDWEAAQGYLGSTLEHDTANAALREQTFLLSLGSGNIEQAERLAPFVIERDAAARPVAEIFLAAKALSTGDLATAEKYTNSMQPNGFGAYIKPVFSAWILAARGEAQDAIARLLSDNANDPVRLLHAALIADGAGRDDDAAALYAKLLDEGANLHAALAAASFFTRSGKPDIANAVHDGLAKAYPLTAFSEGTRPAPAQGVTIALYELASILQQKKSLDSARIYAHLARMADPSDSFPALLLGDIAALRGRGLEAEKSYAAVPEASPLHGIARLRAAELLQQSGDPAKAADILLDLAKAPQLRLPALSSLGDLYRRSGKYRDAVSAYDDALQAAPPGETEGALTYARAMARDRLGDWAGAEKDLLHAASLRPDDAEILNYLGYSWTDRGVNADKARELLEKAASLKPNDGYILDSLGWAHYRSGEIAKAVDYLERAVALVPDDATLLDHLGDAYWQAGRTSEARFKWARAAELGREDPKLRSAIESKLRSGLSPRDKEARL